MLINLLVLKGLRFVIPPELETCFSYVYFTPYELLIINFRLRIKADSVWVRPTVLVCK